jgi:hypothetical protein
MFSFNPRMKLKKNLISYCKTSGIAYLKKHLSATHSLLCFNFEKEVNYVMRGSLERQIVKNKPNTLGSSIYIFFLLKTLSKRMM